MNATDEQSIDMDANDLYREEMITDRQAGTIRLLTPIKSDGTVDPSREISYIGQAQIMTPMGALPLSFEIPANSLAEAVANYGEQVQLAVEQAEQELQELRRQASSSIVVPGMEGGGLGGSGGLPGGGIQLR